MANSTTAVDTLNRAKYAGLDFDTHSDDLRVRIQAKFGAVYNDFAVSSLGMMLLDVIAFGLDTLSFYLDRRATDTFLPTARTRKAVSRLTRQLGYRMRGAVSSSVSLDVTPAVGTAVPFLLPAGFQFQGPNETIFEVAQDTTFSAVAKQEILCYEGETVTEVFVSDGTSNQVFELRRVPADKFVVEGTVKVTVDGAEFDESEFITFDATDQFEAGLNDDPPTIRFGDGVSGNIPKVGAEIVVVYVTAFGLSGQVAKNTITDVVTPLVVNFVTVELTVDNPKAAVGGDDAEDLEHAKYYAGLVFKSRYVAITKGDYEALGGSYGDPLYGRVAVAKALSVRSAEKDVELANLIANIKDLVLTFVSPVRTSLSDANTALDTVDADLIEITDSLALIVTSMGGINTDLSTAISTARTLKNKVNEVTIDANDIKGEVTDGKAAIDAITTGGSDALTAPTKNALKQYFSTIDGEADAIISSAATIASNADSVVGTLGGAQDKVEDVGTSLITGELENIEDARASIETEVGAIGTPSTGIRKDLEDIDSEADAVDTTDGYSSQVNAELDAIYDHVDAILSNDCKSNLVSVPILTRDSSGFYAAPTIGLIRSLQAYLDARKEVTQTVVVSSGENFLIYVLLTIRVGVRSGYAESVVETAIDTVVSSILKDRKFGVSLYVSDIYDQVIAQVEGISFLNVTINGVRKSYGSGDSLAVSAGVVTLYDATAFFSVDDEDRKISLESTENPENVGDFEISQFVDIHTIKFPNSAGVAETSDFSWTIFEEVQLDDNGNLIIEDSEIITKGSVTITTEAGPSSSS